MKYPVLAKVLNRSFETVPFVLSLPGKGSTVIDLDSMASWEKKFELMKNKAAADQIKHGLSEILKGLPKSEKVGLDVAEAFRQGGWRLKPHLG